MTDHTFDVAIIGGGIVGLATARALVNDAAPSLVLLEAEERLAVHQTGHNSGVIHSGLYYRPGSLKARLCAAGRRALYAYCREQGIPHEPCGKVVLATHPAQVKILDRLEERGRANGLRGIERVGTDQLGEIEPHAQAVAALAVPETGIVDYEQVAAAMARDIEEAGGEIRTRCRFLAARREAGGLSLETTQGSLRARVLVNCAGLQSDRVARACGVRPTVRILPFRGEYYALVPGRTDLVKNLVYPVPDPRFPFLGVHFTRMIDGGVEAGPNAVLGFAREGYERTSFSPRDTWDIASYPGSWLMALKYAPTGVAEMWRSWSKKAFVRALRRLIPDVGPDDIARHGSGIRAQAVDRLGRMVDDFRVESVDSMVHVLNAPSPAATSSLAIGDVIAHTVRDRLA